MSRKSDARYKNLENVWAIFEENHRFCVLIYLTKLCRLGWDLLKLYRIMANTWFNRISNVKPRVVGSLLTFRPEIDFVSRSSYRFTRFLLFLLLTFQPPYLRLFLFHGRPLAGSAQHTLVAHHTADVFGFRFHGALCDPLSVPFSGRSRIERTSSMQMCGWWWSGSGCKERRRTDFTTNGFPLFGKYQ